MLESAADTCTSWLVRKTQSNLWHENKSGRGDLEESCERQQGTEKVAKVLRRVPCSKKEMCKSCREMEKRDNPE